MGSSLSSQRISTFQGGVSSVVYNGGDIHFEIAMKQAYVRLHHRLASIQFPASRIDATYKVNTAEVKPYHDARTAGWTLS